MNNFNKKKSFVSNNGPIRINAETIKQVPAFQLKPKYEYVDGYFRYQLDEQPVIDRTEQQEKICNEFFIIQNLKTTTCNPELKKRAYIFNMLSRITMILGVFLLILSIAEVIENSIWSFVCLGSALLCGIIVHFTNTAFENSISTKKHPKVVMKDETFEALVEKKIEEMNVVELAHERLGLDKSQTKEVKPIIITANAHEDYTLKYYNKVTNNLYTSSKSVTVLFFTNEQLFVYKIVFDMCCDVQKEWTNEFFHDDICDLSTTIKKNIFTVDDEKFEYSTIDCNIIVTNSSIGFTIEGSGDRFASVQAMKQKIRDKKNQCA